MSQPNRQGDVHERAAVKDRLAEIVAARIAFFEKAVDNAAQ
jgi:hypothetical protein